MTRSPLRIEVVLVEVWQDCLQGRILTLGQNFQDGGGESGVVVDATRSLLVEVASRG